MNVNKEEDIHKKDLKQKKNFFSFFKINNWTISILSIVMLSLLIIGMNWKKKQKFYPLYHYLPPFEENHAIQELDTLQIPYKINPKKDGNILVPENKLHAARSWLSSHGIPGKKQEGYEILDNNKFDNSPFKENINYTRSIEGELATTINYFKGIDYSRVHITIPQNSFLIQDHQPPSVSVLLFLESKHSITKSNVQSIVNLLLNSIKNLNKNNITIVDQWKRSLFYLDTNHEYVNNPHMNFNIEKYTTSIENKFKNKIETMLSIIYGKHNIQTEVTAIIDQDNKKTSKNTLFQSNSNNNKLINTSLIKKNKYVKNKLKDTIKNKNQNNSTKTINQTKINNTINQSVPNNKKNNISSVVYKKTLSKNNIGKISQLSVSVLLNYKKDKTGKIIPIEKKEIQKIKNIIYGTIGFSEKRKDIIKIENIPFFQDTNFPFKPIFIKSNKNTIFSYLYTPFIIIFSMILIGLFSLIVYFQIKIFSFLKQEKPFKNTFNDPLYSKDTKHNNDNPINNKNNISTNHKKPILHNHDTIKLLNSISKQDPNIITKIIRKWIK